MLLTGIDQIILRGKAPWTLSHHKPDHEATVKKELAKKIGIQKLMGF